jgi:penicillin-binding protein 1A
MFKNSSLYNPIRNPVGVRNRRNVVLSQMAKYDFISEEIKDSIQATELEITYTPQGHDEGIATYFREYARKFMHNWIKENPKTDGTEYNIYSDGLKIYTTINSKMQEYAEAAVDQHMRNLQLEFDKQNKKNELAPFRDVTEDEVDHILNSAMKRSDRWREMKKQGKTKEEIIKSFSVKTKMRIFTWSGDMDTLMTPMDSIRYHKSILQASLMSMTPQTGEVKAWVGGISYKYFKYDMVKKGKRQIGSTFKPFVYATVIDQMHMSPCDTLPNTLHTIAAGKYGLIDPWTPKNSGDKYGGMISLKDALAQSINTVTARLIDRVGPKPVLDLVSKMGVDTRNILEVPSIALGTPDVSLFEMVGSYSTFANQGVYIKPSLITRIEDKNSSILYQNIPETKDVLSEEAAYVTISLMEGVTQSGSGSRLRHDWAINNPVYKSMITGYPWEFENSIAGKTGTTQNQSDGWFMGVVPNLVTGVWVGGEDRSTHFSEIAYGQGASMALPIWANYMKDCYGNEDLDISKEDFIIPEFLSIETDCDKWKEQLKTIDNEIPEEF